MAQLRAPQVICVVKIRVNQSIAAELAQSAMVMLVPFLELNAFQERRACKFGAKTPSPLMLSTLATKSSPEVHLESLLTSLCLALFMHGMGAQVRKANS
jgi:hypothetical protein